jgi:polysaccharide deacetylase family protein (PEP-CTERM system associated)
VAPPDERRVVPAASSPPNVFTVDLEEWFHICGVGGELSPERWPALPSRVETTTERVLALLDDAGVTATFFVLGWVAERYPQLIERVRTAGHEIGSHGFAHQRAYDLGPEGFRDDLRKSLAVLRGTGVPEVRFFRAPEWSINTRSLWALEILAAEGFVADASMAPVRIVGETAFPRYPHNRATPKGVVLEAPPLVADRFRQVMPMGWGWGLRMSSPRRVLRSIESVNTHGWPAVLTLHPWEIDPDPPHVRLPAGLRFAHYFRLGGFESRLREVLRGNRFGPLSSLVRAYRVSQPS